MSAREDAASIQPDAFDVAATARPCKVARVLAEMPDESRAIAEAAIAGPTHRYPSARIARVLGRHGWPIAPATVAIHREGRCSCARGARDGS